jgi:hypothetical protein
VIFCCAVTVYAGIEKVADRTLGFAVTFVANGYCRPLPEL